MYRLPVACLLFALAAAPVAAAPVAYLLDRADSSVAFETDFGADRITGSFPIIAADLTLDFDRVANSRVAVTLDVAGASASFPFAAQALRGPKVLDAAEHPRISFRSTKVTAEGDGARVEGKVTVRGVTQPMVMRAEIYRQKGTEAGDRSHLTVRLTGSVARSAFGASGWSDMVGDEVRLTVLARIDAAP
jgi:polyisoprenoid-binding protein YceI